MLQWLPWDDAAVVAGATGVTTLALRTRRSRAAAGVVAWTRELTLMFALYALWQEAGDHSLSDVGGAVGRGAHLARIEHDVGLPSERSFQALFLGHHELVRLLDIYYAQVHVPALGVCLVWLFVRHRDRYPAVRNVVVAVTGACLLIQLLPIAPPRLVPSLGVVDTGRLIGPSVYPATAAPGIDQLSAMPSLHVAWALIVASALIVALRARWRWVAPAYPAVTVTAVVATGNHYWADGIVATVLTAAAWAAVVAIGRRRAAQASGQERVTPDAAPQRTGGILGGRPTSDAAGGGSDEGAGEGAASGSRTEQRAQV